MYLSYYDIERSEPSKGLFACWYFLAFLQVGSRGNPASPIFFKAERIWRAHAGPGKFCLDPGQKWCPYPNLLGFTRSYDYIVLPICNLKRETRWNKYVIFLMSFERSESSGIICPSLLRLFRSFLSVKFTVHLDIFSSLTRTCQPSRQESQSAL